MAWMICNANHLIHVVCARMIAIASWLVTKDPSLTFQASRKDASFVPVWLAKLGDRHLATVGASPQFEPGFDKI